MTDVPTDAASSLPDHADVLVHPPLVLLCAIVAGLVLAYLFPLAFVPGGLRTPLGAGIFCAAWLVFFWALVSFRRGGASVQTGTPSDALVERGPYRFTRNPIYLAMVLLQVGLAVWVDTVWLLVSALVTAAILQLGVIAREERYLERKLGQPYRAYRGRVRRWL